MVDGSSMAMSIDSSVVVIFVTIDSYVFIDPCDSSDSYVFIDPCDSSDSYVVIDTGDSSGDSSDSFVVIG